MISFTTGMYFDVTEIVPTVMGRFKFDKDDKKVRILFLLIVTNL